MEPKTKQSLLVTVVGVTLFVALLRLSDVLAFAAKLIDLVLPILAGGILALFINVPMTGLEKRLNRLFGKAKKQPSAKAIHLLSFFITLLGVVLVLHPFDAAIGVTMLCGILLIVEGALNLGCVLYAAMELRTLDRMANAAASAAMSAIGDALDEAEAAESGIPMDGPVVYNAESKDVSDEE